MSEAGLNQLIRSLEVENARLAHRIAELESRLVAAELENKMANAANEAAGKIEFLLRQRLQDVRMYLLTEADKHTPRDPVLGEAYQMTQRNLEWHPAAAFDKDTKPESHSSTALGGPTAAPACEQQ